MQRSVMYQAVLILSFFSFIITGYSQPAGWSNREAFYITENTGSALYNYQVRLQVNTQLLIAGGLLQANGEDLRFGGDCAGTVLYNYWIESGINTDSTIIWVKMDSLSGGSVNALFMYYGNPSATAVSAVHTTFSGPHSATDSVSNTTQNIVGDSSVASALLLIRISWPQLLVKTNLMVLSGILHFSILPRRPSFVRCRLQGRLRSIRTQTCLLPYG